MREPPSEGIFRAGTLGYIRFFWPSNQIGLENLLVEVVLPALLATPHLQTSQSSSVPLLHLLVFATDLFAGAVGEVGMDEAEVCTVKLDKLILRESTS